jgi:hypothetical protein
MVLAPRVSGMVWEDTVWEDAHGARLTADAACRPIV